MSKKRGPFNFGASDTFGGQSLDDSPIYRRAEASEVALEQAKPLEQESTVVNRIKPLQYEAEEYNRYVGGDFSGSPEDIDYRMAEGQNTAKQTWNGAWRLIPLTATKLLGQIGGIGQAVDYASGNKDAFEDNEFTSAVNSWEESVKKAMPIYATRAYDGSTLLEQMGTAKFWADDVGDGIAFLAAQFIGTKGLAAGLGAVGKGASYLAKGAEGINLASKVPAAAKVANAIANNYTAVTAGVVNAGFTGALQAQDTRAQIVQGLQGKVNPKTGMEYTPEQITEIASDHAANTFNATFAAHIFPGIWESRVFLGLNKAKIGEIRQGVMDGVMNKGLKLENLLAGVGSSALMKSSAKAAAKGFAKGAAIEGIWEENVEQSIQNYDIASGLQGNDANKEKFLSADWFKAGGKRSLDYALGMVENFTTKEDSKAIALGMILGGPMGLVSERGKAVDFNNKMTGLLNSLKKSDGLLQNDIKSFYKTTDKEVKDDQGNVIRPAGSLILGEDGQPIPDPEKLKTLVYQTLNQKELWDQQTVATLTGNRDMVTMNENMAMSAAVFRELGNVDLGGNDAGALDFLKWRIKQQLKEQEEAAMETEVTEETTVQAAETATDPDTQGKIEAQQAATKAQSASSQFNGKEKAAISKIISETMQKIDSFSDLYKQADTQSRKLTKINQSPDRAGFNKVVQKGLFYESVKRQSMDEMIRMRQEELKDPTANIEKITAEIESITALRNDSLEKSKQYLNNTDEVYTAYKTPRGRYDSLFSELMKVKQEEQAEKDLTKKDEISKKSAILAYQMEEMADVEGFQSALSPVFNEEIISEDLAKRANKPVGTRNEFFWNAGNDYTRMTKLNEKISAYEQGEIPLTDVINYAKESITRIDSETLQKLHSLLTAEREQLSAVEAELDITESYLIDESDEDELGEENPRYNELVTERVKLQESVDSVTEALQDKEIAMELEMVNNTPEQINPYLIKKFALKHFEKGELILQSAFDENGEVKEDYVDNSGAIDRAMSELSAMRDATMERTANGDLAGVKGFAFLISDAKIMLDKLEIAKKKSIENANNLLGQQLNIGIAEAESIIRGFGYSQGVAFNQPLFNILNEVMNGILAKAIDKISALQEHHYEGAMSLLHSIQTRATPGQLSEINKALDESVDNVMPAVVNMLGTTGTDADLVSAFKVNPRQVFMDVWKKAAFKAGTPLENTKGSLLNKYKRNNNIKELIAKAETAPEAELGMPRDTFFELTTAYNIAVSAEKVKKLLETKIKPQVISEMKTADGQTLAPTTEQNIAIREGVNFMQRSIEGTSAFKGWAFLRGIAGTGKTNVVLRWMLETAGIDRSKVLTTALTDVATKVVGESAGSQSIVFSELLEKGIPSDIDLLIIDEYATIEENDIKNFEKLVNERRQTNKNFKVIMLGDPTQITPRRYGNSDINSVPGNANARNIEIINPVTVVYRSDVSAVNDASALFQDNNTEVSEPKVKADKSMGRPLAKGVHFTATSQSILDTIKDNIQAETEQGLAPRSRAIIVATPEDIVKYEGLGADVMTVYNAQSRTYDEVYVDMASTSFPNIETFNTAMYTGLSRAKQYSMAVYQGATNVTDPYIESEFTKNMENVKDSKTKFIKAKTQELAFIDGADNGKTVDEVAKDKAVKADVEDAGKSSVEREADIVEETDEEPDVVEGIDSIAEESDTIVDDDPDGAVDPETEEEVEDPEPIFVPNVSARSPVDHVDKEAYPALRKRLIGPGSQVIYLYNKEPGQGNSITLFAKGKPTDEDPDGQWVKIGKLFAGDLESPRYKFLTDKIAAGKIQPYNNAATDVLNGRATASKLPLSTSALKNHIVQEGIISKSQYLRFIYDSALKGSANMASKIADIFREKFYYESQAGKSTKIQYKIFTHTELSPREGEPAKYDGTFRVRPGIPYAMVGYEGKTYKNVMFVQLQANRISKDDEHIVILKRLADSVRKVQEQTGIAMGTPSFNDLIRVFRNSLKIVPVQNSDGTGTENRIQPLSWGKEDVIAAATEMFEADKKDKDPDILKGKVEDKTAEEVKEMIANIQNLAMQLYGIKEEDGKYTKAEIDAKGPEYESVNLRNPQKNKDGDDLFYAKLKDSTSGRYLKEPRLEVENSKAQIAFNQIAQSNEFIGKDRIRVKRYLGEARAERRSADKGKSLISAEGGSSRLWEMMKLAGYKFYAKGLIDSGEFNEKNIRTSAGVAAMMAKVREEMDASPKDNLLFLQEKLGALKDPFIDEEVKKALARKETRPIGLHTLDALTADSNFADGQHKTQDSFEITSKRGSKMQQTYVRKPLILKDFNKLGQNPTDPDNAKELAKMVHTTFTDLAPTAIEVDISSQVVQATPPSVVEEEPVINEAPITTELHQSIDEKIADLQARIAAETDPEIRMDLRDDLLDLEESRGRMPYDQNSDKPLPGKRIDQAAALAELQRLIPGISPSEIEFSSRLMMAKLSKPGENLLGLFDNGKIFLTTNADGTVYDRVLRHEVMHKIYNEFLSDGEKRALRAELDPTNSMNEMQFDEHLADRFMSWQKGDPSSSFSPQTESIFTKILNWLGFYFGNRSAVDTIFNKIEDGKYTKPITVSGVRRAFSDIKKDYQNLENYKQAVSMVHGMLKDSVIVNKLSVSPITMKESKNFVREKLMAKNATLRAAKADQLVDMAKIGEGHPKYEKRYKKLLDVTAEIHALENMFPTRKKKDGSVTINNKIFDQLWKDLYPNFNFKKGGSYNSFDEEYVANENEPLDPETGLPITDAAGITAHTLDADQVNKEGKVSDNVKNFLSFIFRPGGKRINPRYAYLECLRTLNGLSSSEGDLGQSVLDAATENGINMVSGYSDARIVIQAIQNLIDNATKDFFTDETGAQVELPRTARFFDEDTFFKANDDISSRAKSEAIQTEGTTLIERIDNETTPMFISRIVAATGMEKEQVIGYFRQGQAQETMREVMSNFLSQREAAPMIAEQVREGSMANTSTILRYFPAQMYGAERVASTEIEEAISKNWRSISAEVWTAFNAEHDPNQQISIVLKALGIAKPPRQLKVGPATNIVNNLSAFQNIISNAYSPEYPNGVPIKDETNEGLEAEIESISYKDVNYYLAQENSLVSNLTRLLTHNSADSRPSKYQSIDGKSRYSFFNSSQAIEVVQRVINASWMNTESVTDKAKRDAKLPPHLRNEWAQKNILIDGKISRIHKLVDHDGMRRKWGEEFAKGYSDENSGENMQRNFSYGFLAFAKANASKTSNDLSYVQFFYTISNRPRIIGAEMSMMKGTTKGEQLFEAGRAMLLQHVTQPEHSSVKNFDRTKGINMRYLREAMDNHIPDHSTLYYNRIANERELQNQILNQFMDNLKVVANETAERMVEEGMMLGDNASEVAAMLKAKGYIDKNATTVGPIQQKKGHLGYTKEQILPLVEVWAANNYINGYFLNQLPVGNYNYFENALDLVKRMSGVFAPGTKGLVSPTDQFFMKKKFKVAVMNDPRMFSDELSQIFKDYDTALYNELKNTKIKKKRLTGTVEEEKGFELADGQGFMLPSRAENIVAGMGKAYNAGVIFKPAHYEVVDKGELGFVPFMMKYSSVVLTNEITERFPKLKALRDAMERGDKDGNPIDEFIFDSVNKVGQPTDSNEDFTKRVADIAYTKKLESEQNAEILNAYKNAVKPDFLDDTLIPDTLVTDITVNGKNTYKGESLGTEETSKSELLKEQEALKTRFKELEDLMNCLAKG